MNWIKVSNTVEINPAYISVIIRHESAPPATRPEKERVPRGAEAMLASHKEKTGRPHPASMEVLTDMINKQKERSDANYKEAMSLYQQIKADFVPKVRYEVIVNGQAFSLPKHPKEYLDEV